MLAEGSSPEAGQDADTALEGKGSFLRKSLKGSQGNPSEDKISLENTRDWHTKGRSGHSFQGGWLSVVSGQARSQGNA